MKIAIEPCLFAFKYYYERHSMHEPVYYLAIYSFGLAMYMIKITTVNLFNNTFIDKRKLRLI